ncbi:MAG TPA: hypothetical protein VII73_07855 [Caulobacteraceae bacterium]
MAKRPTKETAERVEGESLLNRQVIEAMLSQLGSTRNSRAVDEAQEIMFDAWECDNPKRRVALARKALTVSPHCADAFVMLAGETARTPEDAAEIYAKGVAAGEKALGKAAFKEDVGMFWGLIETRPYMRARHGLAIAQWEAGRRENAVEGALEMLRLNPNDNQGIRYVLLNWLLQLGRDADAAALMKRYKNDGGTEWLWSAALAAFRVKGDCAASRAALTRAIGANGHVGAFLTGRKKLPRRLADFVAVRSADEAVAYVTEAAATWAATTGAREWVIDQLPPPATPRRRVARKAQR